MFNLLIREMHLKAVRESLQVHFLLYEEAFFVRMENKISAKVFSDDGNIMCFAAIYATMNLPILKLFDS
jgi:hypothetical protein